MKTRIFLVIVAASFLVAGCTTTSNNLIKKTSKETRGVIYLSQDEVVEKAGTNYFVPTPQPGWVPLDLQNPILLGQEVWVFEGSTPVTLVPTSNIRRWRFSRPVMAHFPVDRAGSEANWHNYERIYLPRNSSFIVASRTVNFWGTGPVEWYSIRMGSNPDSIRYTRITPTYPPATAGGLVRLRENAIRPLGDGPTILEYTIDLRIGRPIARAITGLIYGR